MQTTEHIVLCVFDYESLQLGRLFSIVSSDADKINTKIRIAEKILFFININKDINRIRNI